MKKRILGIALTVAILASLLVGGTVLAADPTEGVISIAMAGSGFGFEVWTRTADVEDVFRGNSDSTLEMAQTIRYQPSGQWTSDAPDIDRHGQFSGDGSLETESWYDSTKAWWDGASYTKYYVESDTAAFLGQNLHFDGYFGGVKDVDQWKKQRDAQIYAEGNYSMSLFSVDQREVDHPDYGFSFEATDSGSKGTLFVDTLATIAGHNGPDKIIVDFIYSYDGSPGVDISFLAKTGGSITIITDFLNETVSGSGSAW